MQKSRSEALLERLQQKARERQNQSSRVEGQILTKETTRQKKSPKKRKPNKNSSSSAEHELAKKSRLDEVSSPGSDSGHSKDCVKEKTKEKGGKKKKKFLSGL